jgi:tetratricopeptide (TPR) repeat protein
MVRVLGSVATILLPVARLVARAARVFLHFRRIAAGATTRAASPSRANSTMRGRRCAALGAASLLAIANAAYAQNSLLNGATDQDVLYQRVLRDPKNVKLTLQYAQVAKDRGDYEAAIAAYEKLLLFNPNLPDIQYELGVMYFSLESYANARVYFEKVASSRKVSPSLRSLAASYLKEIARRQSPTRFAGYFHTGLRYQTNANFGSTVGVAQIGGQQFILEPGFTKKPDWNAFVLNDLNFARDFGNRGDSFEVSLSDYYAKQFKLNQVDLGVAELQFGPRFVFLPEYFSNTTAKLYGILNGVMLGDDPYYRTFGSGVSFDSKINPVTTVSTSVEFRDRKFYDSTFYPTASEQTGNLVTGSVGASGLVYGPVRWVARLSYDWNRSDFDFWSYKRPYTEVGMPVSFDVNFLGSHSGVITPYAGAGVIKFDAADPEFNPGISREDRTWYVGTTIEATLIGQTNFRLNVNYLANDSNVVAFTYRNLSVAFGPSFTF